MGKKKRIVDIVAMMGAIIAIVSGFMLHKNIHHLHIYNEMGLWWLHVITGIILTIAIVAHGYQHKFWFENYQKIIVSKKRVTTILLTVAILVVISGIILSFGNRSNFVSIFHYVTGILFVILAAGHTIKRWKIFLRLF